MKVFGFLGRSITKVIVALLSAALVLFVWYTASPLIVNLLDANLALIKVGCGFLPVPYGAMAESAFRGALAADKALLFAEGGLAVRSMFFALRWVFPIDALKGRLAIA